MKVILCLCCKFAKMDCCAVERLGIFETQCSVLEKTRSVQDLALPATLNRRDPVI